LPAGKGKTNLVRKIAEAFDAKDTVAAAAFRREYPASFRMDP
jgi:hypothetical protein